MIQTLLDCDLMSFAEFIDWYPQDGKQPTVTVRKLIEGEYQLFLFKSGDRINSDIFPELNLMVDDIFQIGTQV